MVNPLILTTLLAATGGVRGGILAGKHVTVGRTVTPRTPYASPRSPTRTFQTVRNGPSKRLCVGCRELKSDVQEDINALKAQIEKQAEEDSTVQIRDPLPPTSKGDIFRACFLVSGLIGSLGVALRKYAATKLQVSGADPDLIRDLTSLNIKDILHLEPKDVAIMLGVAAAVTGLRQLTLNLWEDYQWATDRSNEQVLRPLSPLDLLWVAFLPGITEELLFRGALIPAVYPDWRGILIGALTFGVLHNSGGRNLASATFATIAGGAYGTAFLATNNLLVAMGAHSLSNLFSAAIWLQAHPIAAKYVSSKSTGDEKSGGGDNGESEQEASKAKKKKKKKPKSDMGFGSS
ncbi:hypothetical protein AAMO2058_000383900 [Amorphochlora amoebiformis]